MQTTLFEESSHRVAVESAPVFEAPAEDAVWGTEALMGEPVQVLSVQREWANVLLPLQPTSQHETGYPGWIKLHALVESRALPRWRVIAGSASVVDEHGNVCARLALGSLLGSTYDSYDSGPVPVALPRGERGYVSAHHVAVWPLAPAGRDALLSGLDIWSQQPYVWGGTSSRTGTDCSGLTHRLYGRIGRVLPRDAHDQFDMAPRKLRGSVDDAEKGDLVFFQRLDHLEIDHVGVYMGDGVYLSAYRAEHGISIHEVSRDHCVGWASYL